MFKGEFVNAKFTQLLGKMSDIKHELSIIYTLEYIGFIERGN
jgi:hypothetical protein